MRGIDMAAIYDPARGILDHTTTRSERARVLVMPVSTFGGAAAAVAGDRGGIDTILVFQDVSHVITFQDASLPVVMQHVPRHHVVEKCSGGSMVSPRPPGSSHERLGAWQPAASVPDHFANERRGGEP